MSVVANKSFVIPRCKYSLRFGSCVILISLLSFRIIPDLWCYLDTFEQKGIDENWEAALEHNPEGFARVVCMLWFRLCFLNSLPFL